VYLTLAPTHVCLDEYEVHCITSRLYMCIYKYYVDDLERDINRVFRMVRYNV
jgi:hypothetical protein